MDRHAVRGLEQQVAIQQELLDRVMKSPRLPSIPAVALKIIDLVHQDEVNMDQIAETIRLDPALSTKILKTVNSSFYGQPKTVGTINQAIIVLGLNSVKTLALGFSLVGNLSEAGAEGFDHVSYWKRSLLSATAAKQVCDHMVVIQAEEVFMASLLQDVGMLALSQVLGSQYAHLQIQTKGNHRKLMALERAALKGDHAEVGATLIEGWGLPPVIAEPIRYHETPDEAPENLAMLARIVTAGGCIADVLMSPDDPAHVERCNEHLHAWFEMDPAQCESILGEVHRCAKEMQGLFTLPIDDLGNTDDILRRAKDALEKIGLQSAKQALDLQRSNDQLQEEVNTDALTGVANRRRFDADAATQFAKATLDKPLTVMFMDIDHFKQFNDLHGHATGDEVLKAFAQSLVVGGDTVGTAYRYGGEEFAMLFPGVDQKAAALIAERIRESVDTGVWVAGPEGERLNVTVSIGVATFDGTFFKRIDQLVKAADRGVYAAKSAGRNCVRVFVPRVDPESQAA